MTTCCSVGLSRTEPSSSCRICWQYRIAYLRYLSHWWKVDQLNEKLAELEEEREELAEFQRLDKQRRALEFAIYDRDLSSTKASLEEVTCSCVSLRPDLLWCHC